MADHGVTIKRLRKVTARPVDANRQAFLSFVFVLPTVAYALGFSALRPLGEIVLLSVVALGAIAAIVRGHLSIPTPLALYAIFSFFILNLSLARLMPQSWTLEYSAVAAVRQWAWVPILIIMTNSLQIFLERALPWIQKSPVFSLIVVYALTRVSLAVAEGDIWSYKVLPIYVLHNENAIVCITFFMTLFRTTNVASLIAISSIGLLAVNSSQSIIVIVSSVIVRFCRFSGGRGWRLCLVFSVVVLSFISVFMLRELSSIDHNSALRALFWRDVLFAVVDSWGAGVGYGTESMRNILFEIRDDQWVLRQRNAEDFIHIATHSTIFDVLLRTGIVGLCIVFIWIVKVLVLPVVDQSKKGLFFILVLSFSIINTVNSGVVSMHFIIGSAALLALMKSLVSDHRVRDGQARP
jgi:hypothetical protein